MAWLYGIGQYAARTVGAIHRDSTPIEQNDPFPITDQR